MATPFDTLPDFLALARLTGLVASADGSRLVATVQQLDAKATRYVTSLWEIDPAGKENARRITHSAKGESAPAFLPDGSLLFTSSRPDAADPDGGKNAAALWLLPASGEARRVAQSPGGLSSPVTAVRTTTFVASTDRLPGASEDADKAWRTTRSDNDVTALIHDGFPIRYWDHELGPDFPRLLAGTADGELRELAPDAGSALVECGHDLSADGSTVVTEWRVPDPHGQHHTALVAIDVATGRRTTLTDSPDEECWGSAIAPDGGQVAAIHETIGDHDTPLRVEIRIHDLAGGAARTLQVSEDVWPWGLAWSPDCGTLYVTGDRQGRGAILALNLATGARRYLATDACYTHLCPSPDGRSVYAVRTLVDAPPAPVRLDADATDQQPVFLPAPAPQPELPGRLTEVTATAPDGATVQGWLVTPAGSDGPAPLQVRVHGGPIMATGSWSWRSSPWLAAARGWAVLMPNPALSTGFGQGWIDRAWPHRARLVWTDVEALLDSVVARDDIDGERTACLGGSFGGYMTNWIAGHTDRFAAIATHSGLWAADQQHATTDAAWWKTRLFGRPADHPDWYAENSPHNFVDRITTPMLISHGNLDYRVPYSEALRQWWDLVNSFDGDPADLPHRFLQFPDENHWILAPHHIRIWNETIFAFLDWHVLGREWQPPELA